MAPLPGTQIRIEKDHEEAMKFYEQYLQQVDADNQRRIAMKMAVKQQSATLQTNVYFDTLFGQTINKAEAVLNEKERILKNNDSSALDEMSVIDKFRKHIELGKAHYVGMAVSNGFKSIDFQDHRDNGNTFLHIACRKGHVDTVEELLKYKANPDIKNEFGNYPIHEAWLFWENDVSRRTREQRLDQEQRTSQIVLKLLAYGGYADAQDLNGQTPLHIACRLGTTQTVKILLTFFANIDMRMTDKFARSAIEIAEEFEQFETMKLLGAWEYIRPHFVHTDFHLIWHKFLQDYEAIISSSKTAETILSELELEQNAHYMQRASKTHAILIDDPLLRQAFQATQQSEDALGGQKIPKPWEHGWKRYVKQTKLAGVLDLKTRLESLKTKLKDKQTASTNKQPRRSMNLADHRRSLLPDRPIPLTWAERQEKLQLLQQSREQGEGLLEDDESVETTALEAAQRGTELAPSSAPRGGRAQEQAPIVQSVDDEATLRGKYGIHERRRHFAQQVCLDAKFLPFTKQLTQDSALSLSLRTAAAPRENTEEETSILRTVLSQGTDFERLQKYKEKESQMTELLGLKRTPKKNRLGAYCEATEISQANPRDALYDQLSNLAERNVIAGAESVKTAAATAASVLRNKQAADPDLQKTVDLVNASSQQARPRYVQAQLLPAKYEMTKVERMIKAAQDAEEAAQLQKNNLLSDAAKTAARERLEAHLEATAGGMEAMGARVGDETTIANDGDDGAVLSQQKRRAEASKQRALRKLFLADTKVKYGDGRLLSSHHMKGKLQEPWSTIDDKYKTLPGDRTV